uniref:Uncharacterized protein n=1 Tax=Arundo donax TaxID=35708 RepID=A0A0A9A924_ARUDO
MSMITQFKVVLSLSTSSNSFNGANHLMTKNLCCIHSNSSKSCTTTTSNNVCKHHRINKCNNRSTCPTFSHCQMHCHLFLRFPQPHSLHLPRYRQFQHFHINRAIQTQTSALFHHPMSLPCMAC